MSTGEKGSTGTTMAVLLLGIVLGAALGYWYASRAPRVGPPPAPGPRVREVGFELKDKQLAEKHAAIYLTADRGDKIVWKSDTVKEFTVTVSRLNPDYDKAWYQAFCLPDPGPENPFQSAKAEFKGVNNRAESAAAKPEAKGHCYKYTISTPGAPPLDPHIIFD